MSGAFSSGFEEEGPKELMRLYQTIHTDHEVSSLLGGPKEVTIILQLHTPKAISNYILTFCKPYLHTDQRDSVEAFTAQGRGHDQEDGRRAKRSK